MNPYANPPGNVVERRQRLETLQSARQWQPTDSIEAARLDSQISTLQGVIRLLEYHEPDLCH
jgi:hypothetical protein